MTYLIKELPTSEDEVFLRLKYNLPGNFKDWSFSCCLKHIQKSCPKQFLIDYGYLAGARPFTIRTRTHKADYRTSEFVAELIRDLFEYDQRITR